MQRWRSGFRIVGSEAARPILADRSAIISDRYCYLDGD
jgi:hypothetical protein